MTINILKNIVFITLSLLILLVSCKNEEKKDIVLFSAKIENPNSDSLSFENAYGVKTFLLNNGELTKGPIPLPIGYYSIYDGKESTMCFLKPNFDLHLTLNAELFDESIKYSGKGDAENNYLAQKYLHQESFGELNNYGYYAKLEEEDFLHLVDSLYNLNIDLYNKNKPNFDKDFSELEFEYLRMSYLIKLANYEGMHRFFTDNMEFTVSSKFPNLFADIILEDEMLLAIPNYLQYIDLHLQAATINKIKGNDTPTFYSTYIDMLDSELKNEKIREEIAYDFGKSRLRHAKDPGYCYNKLKGIISNPEYINKIDELYTKLWKIEKGAIAPTFELYDIDSTLVKLEDFKGKIIYIDIWATWCSPCIKELPDLDKLQTEFKDKNIVFISICQNDDKERWKASVLTKELQGIHLFVHESEKKFLSDYLVTGIPRFILIDENGFIIDSEALRPSNPDLKEQLNELLK